MNAQFVAAATRARVTGPADADLVRVGSDSRASGTVDLFVALHGERFDGNDFIEQAVRGGARGVLCDLGRAVPASGVTFFEVPDTLRALGDLAAAHRRTYDVPLVAITGSNGKTTTKNLLRSILTQAYGGTERVLATQGNLNNLIGMPLTLLALTSRHRAAILEMGMNSFGEIARLTEIAAPTHACITCVAAAHLEGLGSIEGVARAKGELFTGLSERATAIVNLDDARVAALAAGLHCRRLDYGAGSGIRAESVETRGLEGTRFRLILPTGTAVVDFPLIGAHNVANAVAAAACATALGIATEAIVSGLASAPAAPMRLSVERLPNGVDLINDAYNANPGSMHAALGALASLATPSIVVLGAMRELGARAAELHAEVGAAAARVDPRVLCAVGENAHHTVRGAVEAGLASERALEVPTNVQAADAVAGAWRRGDTVLVKGSRGALMEEVVTELRRRASS